MKPEMENTNTYHRAQSKIPPIWKAENPEGRFFTDKDLIFLLKQNSKSLERWLSVKDLTLYKQASKQEVAHDVQELMDRGDSIRFEACSYYSQAHLLNDIQGTKMFFVACYHMWWDFSTDKLSEQFWV